MRLRILSEVPVRVHPRSCSPVVPWPLRARRHVPIAPLGIRAARGLPPPQQRASVSNVPPLDGAVARQPSSAGCLHARECAVSDRGGRNCRRPNVGTPAGCGEAVMRPRGGTGRGKRVAGDAAGGARRGLLAAALLASSLLLPVLPARRGRCRCAARRAGRRATGLLSPGPADAAGAAAGRAAPPARASPQRTSSGVRSPSPGTRRWSARGTRPPRARTKPAPLTSSRAPPASGRSRSRLIAADGDAGDRFGYLGRYRRRHGAGRRAAPRRRGAGERRRRLRLHALRRRPGPGADARRHRRRRLRRLRLLGRPLGRRRPLSARRTTTPRGRTTPAPPTSSRAPPASGRRRRKPIAAAGAAGDRFGYAVAISGDTALVGAPYHDAAGQGERRRRLRLHALRRRLDAIGRR